MVLSGVGVSCMARVSYSNVARRDAVSMRSPLAHPAAFSKLAAPFELVPLEPGRSLTGAVTYISCDFFQRFRWKTGPQD
jgi:hypothetical protein